MTRSDTGAPALRRLVEAHQEPAPPRARTTAVATRRRTGRRAALLALEIAVAAAIALLAFWVRYHLLIRHGGLGANSGYDDGVYYAAADALVHGRLPYRDFLFLQPPGIAVVLAPIAWLGSVTSDPHGVVIGRVGFMALGAMNAVLVAVLCRRFGRAAALVGGVGYALYFPAAYSERTMLLEPVGTTGVLLALLLATGRRPAVLTVLGGAAIGVAFAAKIWYVVPLAVIAAAVPGRRRLWFLAGAAGSVLLLVGPFLLASPARFVRQVVQDQLARPEAAGWPIDRRLESMLGLGTPHLMAPQVASEMPLKLALLGAAALVLAALALTLRGARVFVALATGAVVVLLLTPSYFPHYDALLGPGLALTVGAGVGRLAMLLRHRPLQVALVAGALAAFVLIDRHIDTVGTSSPIPAPALRPAAAQVAGCVTGDEPLVLAELNVLSRDLAHGCTVWVDVTGYTYDRDSQYVRGEEVLRPLNGRWQRDLNRYLLSGDAVIVHRAATGLGTAAQEALRREPVLARSSNWVLRAVFRG